MERVGRGEGVGVGWKGEVRKVRSVYSGNGFYDRVMEGMVA